MTRFPRTLALGLPAIALLLVVCGPAWGGPVQWAGNAHWYEAVYAGPGGIDWTAARQAAEDGGGYLATCTSAAENDFVFSLVSGNPGFWHVNPSGDASGPWIGGYQPPGSPEPGGGWTWVTGEPWSYANWLDEEPDNLGGNQNYLRYIAENPPTTDKKWCDGNNTDPIRGYIVERDVLSAPGEAFFSVQGNFLAGVDVQDFHFALADDVPGDRPFELRTWGYKGTGQEETNAAGDAITPGGFDPSLRLFHPPETPLAQNSDIDFFQGELDARIDHNTPGILGLDPLPAGDYRLRLDISSGHFQSRGSGWAVDLVVPSEAMVLTGLSNAGTESTVTSLKFGAETSASTAMLVVGVGETLEVQDEIVVGQHGNAVLTIGGGSVICKEALLGIPYGGSGTVIVDGTGSSWTVGSSLHGRLAVGWDGAGTLLITNGGTVDLLGSTDPSIPNVAGVAIGLGSNSMVTVDGIGTDGDPSTWTVEASLDVGVEGTGSLAITGGGLVVSTDRVQVGAYSDGTGTITVDGTDATGILRSSLVSSGHLSVGSSGEGELNISGGGLVECTDHTYSSTIGDGTGSRGTVTVAGTDATGTIRSTWANLAGLTVGWRGAAELTVSAGGLVSNTDAYMARWGGTGTVTVSGSASELATWDSSGSVYVGGREESAGGTGTLTVGLGGTVNVADTLKIWNNGTVNLNGGTINTGELAFAGSEFNFNAGKLHFASDPGLDAAMLARILGPTPTVSGDQHLSVAGLTVLLEPLILDGGTFSVGTLANPARLQFNTGTLSLTQGKLTIGLGGMLGRTVEVADGQTIQVTDNAQVDLTGALLISGGAFVSKSTVNYGEIRLGGGTSAGPALLAGGGLGNHGLITGGGRISAPLTNYQEGLISAGPGQRLLLTGGENSNGGAMTTTGGEIEVLKALNNVGQINVVDGTFSVGGILMNVGPTSYVSGQGNVTLRFGEVLSNNGTVGFNAAEAGLYGGIYNGHGGLIAVAGQSTVTFVGGLENLGKVYVGKSSKAVFLSRVIGGGDFPGGGDVEFVDGYQLVPAPAPVNFGGNVLFAPTASLEIELVQTPGELDADGTVRVDAGATLDINIHGGGNEFQAGTYTLIDAADGGVVVGEFTNVTDLNAYVSAGPNGDGLTYNADSVLLTLDLNLNPADANLDGATDVSDRIIWNNNNFTFGTTFRTGDYNDDGQTDVSDRIIWNNHNFTFAPATPGPPGATRVAIPEPATLALLALGSVALARRRRCES